MRINFYKRLLCITMCICLILCLFQPEITFVESAGQAWVYYVRVASDPLAWQGKDSNLVFTDLQMAIDEATQNVPALVFVAVGTYATLAAPNVSESGAGGGCAVI